MLFYPQKESNTARIWRYRILGAMVGAHLFMVCLVLVMNTTRVHQPVMQVHLGGASVIFAGSNSLAGAAGGATGTIAPARALPSIAPTIKNKSTIQPVRNKTTKSSTAKKKAEDKKIQSVEKTATKTTEPKRAAAATLIEEVPVPSALKKGKTVAKKVSKPAIKKEIKPNELPIKVKQPEPQPVKPVEVKSELLEVTSIEPVVAQPVQQALGQDMPLHVISGAGAGQAGALQGGSEGIISEFEIKFASEFNRVCKDLSAYKAHLPTTVRLTVGYDGSRKVELISDLPPAAFAIIKEALMTMDLSVGCVGARELYIS